MTTTETPTFPERMHKQAVETRIRRKPALWHCKPNSGTCGFGTSCHTRHRGARSHGRVCRLLGRLERFGRIARTSAQFSCTACIGACGP